jgi:hypothetical protein
VIVAWAKFDDAFPDHPKVAGLSDVAFRIHVRAICYSARMLTDGVVPMALVEQWLKTPGTPWRKRPVLELEKAGLWTTDHDTVHVHDFLDYNPSRQYVLAKRAADAERKRGGSPTDSTGNSTDLRADSKRPGPARPDKVKGFTRSRRKPTPKPRLSEDAVPPELRDMVGKITKGVE